MLIINFFYGLPFQHTEYSENGNLLNLVLNKKCTSIDLVRLLVQVLSGLIYLHDSNILHGDIRAENIMVFCDEQQATQVIGSNRTQNDKNTPDVNCVCMPAVPVSTETLKTLFVSTCSCVFSHILE